MPLIDAARQEVTAIDLSPLVLSPGFSPDVHDYSVRCAAGDNPVTMTVTTSDGAETSPLVLAEDQLIAVHGAYWIRCLPHDFPAVSVAKYPDVGQPTAGWYLANSAVFAIVFDTNGAPVWYRRATRMLHVNALLPNAISFMPNFNSPSASFQIVALDKRMTTVVRSVGVATDGHELLRFADGNYLVITYPTKAHVDLSGLQSYTSDETIIDCGIQIVNPAGDLVWSWLATDHVDPRLESLEPSRGAVAVDVFHCNAVDVDANGKLLLSMRNANTLLYIDRATGIVEWKFGGTAVNKDGATYIAITGDPEGAFSMQHDARFQPSGNITMYDNHGAPGSVGVARGVEYTRQGEFVSQTLGLATSAFEGSYRRYPDGESVISWGAVRNEARMVTEYDPQGHVVLEIGVPNEISYRAIKVPIAQLDIGLLRASAGE
jgi:hypothetical protein